MRRMLTAVPLLLLAALAACGGGGDEGPGVATVGNAATASASPDPSAPAVDEEERKRQFTQCMRDEGIEIDDAKGPGERVAVAGGDKQKMRQAMEKCRKYLPNGGEPPRPSAADLEKLRGYAVCMRENGLPSFPDPDPETGNFNGDSMRDAGVDKDKIAEVDEKCRDKLPERGMKGGGK